MSQVERRHVLFGTIGAGLLATLAVVSNKQSGAQEFMQNVEPTLQSAAGTDALIGAWRDLLIQSIADLKQATTALNPLTLHGLTKAASDSLTRYHDLLGAILHEQEVRGLTSNSKFNRTLTETSIIYVQEVSATLGSNVVQIIGRSLGAQASDDLAELFAINNTLLGEVLAVASKNRARRGGVP